jgi:hypothetical protein
MSFAQRIRANFPLLRNLSLPVAPFSPDHADAANQCAEAIDLLVSDSVWLKDSIAAPRGFPSVLADLETVTLKLTSKVERLAGVLSDAKNFPAVDSLQSDWQRLPLTEFGEVWHGLVIRDTDVIVGPKIVGRSIPFRNP